MTVVWNSFAKTMGYNTCNNENGKIASQLGKVKQLLISITISNKAPDR